MDGLILHLQRFSTEDGPGIRTTVFFKGCPLHCAWCHNPESISSRVQVQWFESRCIGDQSCIKACPHQALTMKPEGIAIDRDKCLGEGACVEACPSGALELLGRRITAEALTREASKDKVYFEHSGGGVTASGGEPTLQAAFVAELFRLLGEQGIHTALDTCGLYPPAALEQLLPVTNLILYDLKEFDPALHTQWTGQTNTRIFQNLKELAETLRRKPNGTKLWVRTPLIPGATAREENLEALGRWIGENAADVVERWDLLAFNNLCRDKYDRLGMSWTYRQTPLLEAERLQELYTVARAACAPGVNVTVQGAAAMKPVVEECEA